VRRFTPILVTPLINLVRYTEINLYGGTDSRYYLELFVGDRKIEFDKGATQTWTPIQLVYALCSGYIYPLKVLCS